MIDYNTPAEQDKTDYYVIKLKFEHGDADVTTYETIALNKGEEEKLKLYLDFLFAVRNFEPNGAYENLGYYYPIREEDKLEQIAKKFWPDSKYPIDAASGLIIYDAKYSGFAKLEDITLHVNKQKRVLMDMDARTTNIITLPAIDSEFNIDMGHIKGGSSFNNSCAYQTLSKKYGVPLYTDETEQTYTPVTGKVAAYQITHRYANYDTYDILVKLDHEKDVYFTAEISGHVNSESNLD